jgi:hypothetical protein
MADLDTPLTITTGLLELSEKVESMITERRGKSRPIEVVPFLP